LTASARWVESKAVGYSHYHQFDVSHPQFREGWPRLVQEARRIAQAVQQWGVSLRGGYGVSEPVFSSDDVEVTDPWGERIRFEGGAIWLNGDQARDEECETFLITPSRGGGCFTKTQGMPYDLAVSAILLRAHAIMPQAIESDVPMEDDAPLEGDAADLWQAAQKLVDELFE
jgi:hypothetical protein